jgi:hypothetical protein
MTRPECGLGPEIGVWSSLRRGAAQPAMTPEQHFLRGRHVEHSESGARAAAAGPFRSQPTRAAIILIFGSVSLGAR